MSVGRAVALAGLGRGLRDAAGALTRGRQREEERKEEERNRRRQNLGSIAQIIASGGRVGAAPDDPEVPMDRIGELDGQDVFMPRDGLSGSQRAADRRARDKERSEDEREQIEFQERYDALEGLSDAERRAIARSPTAFNQYMDDKRRPEQPSADEAASRAATIAAAVAAARAPYGRGNDDQPTPAQRRTARSQAASGFRSNATSQAQAANQNRDPDPKDYGFEGASLGWNPEGGPSGDRRAFAGARNRAVEARETGLFQAGRSRYSADSTMRAGRHEEQTGEDPDGSLDFEIQEARRGIQEANRLREAAKLRNPAAEAVANRLFREAVAEIRGGLSPEARRALGNYGNLRR